MEQKYIKLSEYATIHRIKYRAAWNRLKKGLIKNAFTDEFGKILIPIENKKEKLSCVIYARVSSNDRKNSLIEQQKRLENFANINNFSIVKSVREVGSGMNDDRKILNGLFEISEKWDVILVENKDRLTRFGFNYIKKLLNKNNKDILVMNNLDDDKSDLMKDLISVIYSFSARMYGLRKKKNKKEIVNFLEN